MIGVRGRSDPGSELAPELGQQPALSRSSARCSAARATANGSGRIQLFGAKVSAQMEYLGTHTLSPRRSGKMMTELKRRLRRSLWFAGAFTLAVSPVALEADPAMGTPVPYDTPAPVYDTPAPAYDTPAAAAVVPGAPAPDVLPGGEVHYYSDAELEDLVSRIALYPDDLIAIVLPAATYPLQVVEAERLLERTQSGGNPQANPQWDPSVVALLNYPDVVKLMNDDLDWMSRLGEASVNQRSDVLAAISRFRDRAYDAGNLHSDDRQTVTRNNDVVEIAPANPEVIYVPYYEPEQVIIYQPYPVFHYYPRPYPVY